MKNHKAYISIIILLMIRLYAFAQTRDAIVGIDKIKCTYNLVNERLSGEYVSFYSNGNKRSEGTLENGYRTGKWIVWDSTGRKRMERIYKNPLEFKRVFPPIPNEGPIPLLIENSYKLEYDSNGIIKYASAKTEDAVWRHKYWRYLEPENNGLLFKDNRILKVVYRLMKLKNVVVYDTVDDRFTKELKYEAVESLINPDNMELVGIELKEEFFFDMNRLVSEYRILGFCPIVKIDGQLTKLFWIYYPDIRKYFGKEIVTSVGNPKIQTLDDLFIFRDFSSSIIKTTFNNPYDHYLKNYPGIKLSDLKKMQETEELGIIESENDIWISLTK